MIAAHSAVSGTLLVDIIFEYLYRRLDSRWLFKFTLLYVNQYCHSQFSSVFAIVNPAPTCFCFGDNLAPWNNDEREIKGSYGRRTIKKRKCFQCKNTVDCGILPSTLNSQTVILEDLVYLNTVNWINLLETVYWLEFSYSFHARIFQLCIPHKGFCSDNWYISQGS